jgi:hypothetical protein
MITALVILVTLVVFVSLDSAEPPDSAALEIRGSKRKRQAGSDCSSLP